VRTTFPTTRAPSAVVSRWGWGGAVDMGDCGILQACAQRFARAIELRAIAFRDAGSYARLASVRRSTPRSAAVPLDDLIPSIYDLSPITRRIEHPVEAI